MQGNLPAFNMISIFTRPQTCSLRLQGKDAIPFLEKLVVGDIKAIENGSGTLSVFTNERGGIIDDTVVTKARTPNQNALSSICPSCRLA